MKLYVMRHAQASFNAPSDQERPITEKGLEQTNELIKRIKNELSDVEQIWSSELLRAKQTASAVSDVLALPTSEHAFLSPDVDPRDVLEKINALNTKSALLIVSHQPLVGELVSLLVNGNAHQAHPYSTSEILFLEADVIAPGMASLVKQYLPPA